ncbi:MAG: HAD-IIIA family hydrolase [Angustibacter sp.]
MADHLPLGGRTDDQDPAADHDAADGLTWSVVVATLGRPSLAALLESLTAQPDQPFEVIVVDDRRHRPLGPSATPEARPLRLPGTVTGSSLGPLTRVLVGHGAGPAHARNVGWRSCRSTWVVFIDDDVLLPASWSTDLLRDLRAAQADRLHVVGGVQAQVRVPLPADRRPTDAERGTAGLASARWITAEMAYRRSTLAAVGGFDERFPRAFREDADLALRVRRAGFVLRRGRRHVLHPVRPVGMLASLTQQRGNRDDALMRRLHGRTWRTAAECPPGRLRWHVATVVAAMLALGSARRVSRAAATAAWAALTADFAIRRIRPGPRTAREVTAMAVTSATIPFAAVWHRVAGELQHRARYAPADRQTAAAAQVAARPVVRAVLFDRDGTLIHDVPYNTDPSQVRPVLGAREALDRLRHHRIRIGVVTNQSVVTRDAAAPDGRCETGWDPAREARQNAVRSQVNAVHQRVTELLGPFDTWQVCPHGPDDGCRCRKPEPGMVLAAAAELGVDPRQVVVVGDIGADLLAAEAAGAAAVLVPTPHTRQAEITLATHRADTLADAVDLVLAGRVAPPASRPLARSSSRHRASAGRTRSVS